MLRCRGVEGEGEVRIPSQRRGVGRGQDEEQLMAEVVLLFHASATHSSLTPEASKLPSLFPAFPCSLLKSALPL